MHYTPHPHTQNWTAKFTHYYCNEQKIDYLQLHVEQTCVLQKPKKPPPPLSALKPSSTESGKSHVKEVQGQWKVVELVMDEVALFPFHRLCLCAHNINNLQDIFSVWDFRLCEILSLSLKLLVVLSTSLAFCPHGQYFWSHAAILVGSLNHSVLQLHSPRPPIQLFYSLRLLTSLFLKTSLSCSLLQDFVTQLAWRFLTQLFPLTLLNQVFSWLCLLLSCLFCSLRLLDHLFCSSTLLSLFFDTPDLTVMLSEHCNPCASVLTHCVLTDEKPAQSHKGKHAVPPPVGKKPMKRTDPALLAQTDDNKANLGHVDLGRSSLFTL